MKKKSNNFNLILIFCIVFCSFSFANNLNTSFLDSIDSLKKYYISLFNIGAAINKDIILGLDMESKHIVESQFNSITPENSLKWTPLQ